MEPGRLVSVNVGRPKVIGNRHGRPVISGIYKEPVSGPVEVRTTNLDGDAQGDLTVHGGEDKAAYAYPSEHYEFWRGEFPEMKLGWGSFGENLTIQGITEADVRVGDHLVVGQAEFSVTQPRLPCYKLGMKFGTQLMLRKFLESERTGFYLRVVREGKVKAGDTVELMKRSDAGETIQEIVRKEKKSPSE